MKESAESWTIDGESPVIQKNNEKTPSNIEHVKFGVNQQGPPCKAKYFWVTNREIVPWGKGEIEPLLGSEIEHETLSLQIMGGLKNWPCACWRMSRRLMKIGLVKKKFRSRSENEF